MANTNDLKMITQYALDIVSNKVGLRLFTRNIPIGISGRQKSYDGVSNDGSIVVQIINNSGYTSGGKKPSAKIRIVYADCYFMNLTKATRKILAFTNEQFYNIFKKDSQEFIPGFELLYIDLPQDLKDIAQQVVSTASIEMTKS